MTSCLPQRIVSLQPSVTLILSEIGRLDCLVACTKYCADMCPEVRQQGCSILSDSWTANAEQIIASNPDLIIASVPYQEKSVIEILKAGRPFLGLAPHTLCDIYSDISMIAGIVGEQKRGEAVIARMQSGIETVRHKAGSSSRLRVYCEEWGKPLIHSQTWVAELVDAAGGKFIGVPGAKTTTDAIAAEDPDVIIAAWCGAGDRVPLEKIIGDRRWENLRAVQTGRVFCIRDEYLNTPAPSLLHGLNALAAAIRPQQFSQTAGLKSLTVTRKLPSIHSAVGQIVSSK
jgi:iron complex transport system substrate-binding protein